MDSRIKKMYQLEEEKFPNHKDDVFIFTDGSNRHNRYGGWGSITVCKGWEMQLSDNQDNTTNNAMEMAAIAETLKGFKATKRKVFVFSDSAYTVNIITKSNTIHRKVEMGNIAVPNFKRWKELFTLTEEFDIYFFKVLGHCKRVDQFIVAFLNDNDKLLKKLGISFSEEEMAKFMEYNHRADELASSQSDVLKAVMRKGG